MSPRINGTQQLLLDPAAPLDIAGGREVVPSDGTILEGAGTQEGVLEAKPGASDVIDMEDVFASKPRDNKPGRPAKPTSTAKPVAKEVKNGEVLTETKEDIDKEDPDLEEEKQETEEDDDTQEDQISKSRDYSKFSKEDTDYLKKLPNGIYKHVAPLLEKQSSVKKELETTKAKLKEFEENPNRIPDNWFENPNAFTLTPEYQAIADNHTRAEFESSHWEKQLIAISNNQPWFELAYNNGQYFLGTKHENPGKADEISVNRALNDAMRLREKFSAQAENIANSFKEKYKSTEGYYEKLTDEPFKKLIPELQPTEELQKVFMEKIHPLDKNNRLAPVASKMFAVILRQGKYIGDLLNKQKTATSNINDERAAGPGAKKLTRVSAAGKGTVKGSIDFDDLEQEMQT